MNKRLKHLNKIMREKNQIKKRILDRLQQFGVNTGYKTTIHMAETVALEIAKGILMIKKLCIPVDVVGLGKMLVSAAFTDKTLIWIEYRNTKGQLVEESTLYEQQKRIMKEAIQSEYVRRFKGGFTIYEVIFVLLIIAIIAIVVHFLMKIW